MYESNESSSVMDIKTINTDEERKIFGELLSNETSRKIMSILVDYEMYANEIGPKLNLTHKLVHHHLNKMKKINLVRVTLKKITKDGEEHKFFTIASHVLVNLKETKDVDKRILKKIFRPVVRFSGIALIASLLWMINGNDGGIDTDTFDVEQLIFPMAFVIFALIIESVWVHKNMRIYEMMVNYIHKIYKRCHKQRL